MKKRELDSLIAKVAKQISYSAKATYVLDKGNDFLTITVFSKEFAEMSIYRRIRLLSKLFEEHAPLIPNTYTLVYEAWINEEEQES